MPMWLRFALFFVVLGVLLAGTNVYVHRRVSRLFRLQTHGRRILAGLLVLGVVAAIGGRAAAWMGGAGIAGPLGLGGNTFELGVLITAALMLIFDLVRSPLVLYDRWRARPQPTPTPTPAVQPGPAPAPAPTRREFLVHAGTASALATGIGTAGYGALFGRHDYVIEDLTVPIADLPRTLEGYTLVQLSDIHFGLFVGDPERRSAEALVRRARPDLVVLTGDLVDHDIAHAHQLGTLVSRIAPLARDGVAAIPGNHDYYAGVAEVLHTLRRAGARVLQNEGRVIGDRGGAFALLGVDDLWAPRSGGVGPDLDRAIAMVPRDLPRVLLAHNPAFFPDAAGKVALQLSGHTHGGQVNVGLELAHLVLPHGYVAGPYPRGGSTLYVNRGFGTAGPPARVGSPPEVTRIRLVRA